MSFWTRIRRAESIFRGYAATSGAWIRFDQLDKVTLSGSTITRVVSDEGRDLIFGSTALPVSRTLNNLNSADFNGSTQFLSGATALDIILGNTGSLYIDSIINPDSLITGSVYNSAGIASSAGSNRFVLGLSTTGSHASIFLTSGDLSTRSAASIITGNTVLARLNYVDRTSVGTKLNAATGSATNTNPQFAGNYTGLNFQIGKTANNIYFDGRIGEILIRGNNPPDANFQTLRDWWASAKWGANADNFNPSTYGNVQAWYRADRGMTLINNTTVSGWDDSSGFGDSARHLTQSIANQRPTYIPSDSTFNGKPSLYFNGSTFLDSATWSNQVNQPCTIFSVYSVTNSTGQKTITDNLPGNTTFMNWVANTQTSARAAVAAGNISSSVSVLTPGVVCVQYWHGSSQIYANNRTSLDNGTLGVGSLIGLRVGCDTNKTNFHNGRVAEILVYSGTLAAPERNAVLDYLGNRYNIIIT